MKKRLMDLKPTRRDVMKWGSGALAATWANPMMGPLNLQAAGKANPRGTARNCILIEVGGAISQPDCWDYREQDKQPKDLDVRKTPSGVYLSKTLFPQLSDHTDQVSFVRSMRASELVHFNGQYHTQTGRALNAALAKEIPAFGSIIAYELEARRRENDTFPTYFSTTLNTGYTGVIGPGFLPARCAGLDLAADTVFETFGGKTDGLNNVLERHWKFMTGLSEASEGYNGTLGSKESDFRAYYQDAHQILNDPRWTKVFQAGEEDKKRYGDDEYGMGLILARNLIAADAGARFIYVYDGNRWDQHTQIFNRNARQNHYANCVRFDKGYVSLLTDLAKTPGHEPGKSLLDETLIVATSEFGRTPEINPLMGRHHWRFVYTTMFAGGGVKPGRVLGKSDANAAYAVETGWKHKEQPQMDNVVATIYSALGIDWLKRVQNTPSGRAYDYIQTAPIGGSEFISNDSIDELFV